MGRAGDYEIKKWMDSDIKGAQLFNSICNVSEEDAMAFSGMSATRLKTMTNVHYLERKIDKNGKYYYRTTVEGRKKFEEKSGIRGYVSNSYAHDKALYDVYTNLTKEEQNS